MVLASTEALVARTIDDNDASEAVSAALTIAPSSRSVVSQRPTASFLTLCVAMVHPFLPTSSNSGIASALMPSYSPITPAGFSEPNYTTSLKF